jgi:glycine/D-amino acid oxidase-like deaminating enzyme
MSSDRTLLVVGGGPAGVTAALQACELGAQVTLLEAGQIGGTSLNRGPAPVRTLARTARLARDWSSWATFGLDGPPPVPNLPVVVANSDRAARYAHDKKDLAGHLRRHGIDLVENLGPVGFVDPHTLAGDGARRWSADPTGPMPSTSAESPRPRSWLGVCGSSQGGRSCIIQKICLSAFSAMVSGSASTAISRRSGGTTFMYRSRSTTYSAM